MWVLRQYSNEDDELLEELPLEGWRLQDAEKLLGFAPTKLGSTPVDHAVAHELIKGGAPLVIEKNRVSTRSRGTPTPGDPPIIPAEAGNRPS